MKNNKIKNWINDNYQNPKNNKWIQKYNPHTGKVLCELADSSVDDIRQAVSSAKKSFNTWWETTPVERGEILFKMANLMEVAHEDLSQNIAIETGKPIGDARGEVSASIMQAKFFAGEGMRLNGKTLTSSVPGKQSYTVRQPHGIVGLIVPANTPIANIAWKLFPALICGNSVILKSSEDSPSIANLVAEISKKANLPKGVLNVIHGARDAGMEIVKNENISLISFTGSTSVGQWIASEAGKRSARVSLELGGKNAFIVCDDADIDQAVHWGIMSAFSNAGQRCAAASRLIIAKNIYDEFVDKFISRTKKLKLGIDSDCDLGPVINKRQFDNILESIEKAKSNGAHIITGGRPSQVELKDGYYISPTIIEGISNEEGINIIELFGPVVTLQKFDKLSEALNMANNSKFGLTSAIHTSNIDKATWYAQRVKTGVVNINIGTYGSEPHMPFGGFGFSGNGTREPGVEALNVYSELKNISYLTRKDLT